MASKRSSSIGFGIVGLGNIADFHALASRALRGGRLHSCFSGNPEKAEAFAAKHGCRPISNWRQFLDDPDLDVVTVATPSGAHLKPAAAAARAGKHVVIEKPIEVTPARCRRLVAACRKHRVKLVAVFQSRFGDPAQAMKKAIDERRLGRLVNGSAYVKWYRDQAYYDSGAWRGTWELDGGGCLMNQGIHTVDLLVWLMGDPVEVSAYASRPTRKRIEVETNLVANVVYRTGALGVIEASTEIRPGYAKEIQVSGTAGSMSMVEDRIARWDFVAPRAADKKVIQTLGTGEASAGGAADPLAISFDGHRRQFQELVDVLKGKRKRLTCDGAEGVRSVRVIDAIYRSAREGKPVRLRDSGSK
jgi:UDP-N-acetyl-2-amino-2-deoxyglucuronate dehydrogenase